MRPILGVIKDVDLSMARSHYILSFSVNSTLDTPMEWFVLNSKVRNTTNTLFRGGEGGASAT